MLRVGGEQVRTAAVLHNVVEGSDVTLVNLWTEGYYEAVLTAVDVLNQT